MRKTVVPEEPTGQTPPTPPAPEHQPSAEATPTPAPPAENAVTPSANPAPPADAKPVEPLPDGTAPTVLTTADKAKPRDVSEPSKKRGMSSIYRRADVLTTSITFVAALVAAGLVLGGYLYITKSSIKPTVAPKLTTLTTEDIAKLGGFLTNGSAGAPSEILTFNATSLFKNRLAVDNDLKVTGALMASGPTSLGDLIVDKITTLGVTNIRGQLGISGPLTVRSPAVFDNGATVTGNLSVTGNGSFGGTLGAGTINAANLSVTGNLNIGGHVTITSGNKPTAAASSRAGAGASVTLDGNDSSGTVSVTTGAGAISGELVQVNFKVPYAKNPRVVLTPTNSATAALQYFVIKSGTFFTIGTNNPTAGQSYGFDYWVVQ